MYLIDSNILIYSAKADFAYLRPLILTNEGAVSSITRAEVFGFKGLTSKDDLYFRAVFRTLTSLPITDEVIDALIELRKIRKMALGDALIAATAQVHQCQLFTRNVADFSGLGIVVVNPIP